MLNNESEEVLTDVEGVEDVEDEETPEPSARERELEAEVAKYKRMAEQKAKKLEKTKTNESGDFDYGQKAYLVANGVKSDEMDFVKEVMAETGKSLDMVLESKYFQAELKERREAQEMADAIPTGTKRSQQTTRDQAAYWIAKGELPPNTPENQALRRDVVNAKMKAGNSGSRFTTNPVVK